MNLKLKERFEVFLILFQGPDYRRTVSRNDNRKPAFCEANNRYTEIVAGHWHDGRSSTKRFNILCKYNATTSNDSTQQ